MLRSLETARQAASVEPSTVADTGFLDWDGLLFCRHTPAGGDHLDMRVEQLCCSTHAVFKGIEVEYCQSCAGRKTTPPLKCTHS